MIWDTWKKGFDTWENRTAELLETVMKSNVVLAPVGTLLTVTMKMKTKSDRAVANLWSMVGLPNRRDQERTLHALHQLQSRLLDLEEKLAAIDSKSKH